MQPGKNDPEIPPETPAPDQKPETEQPFDPKEPTLPMEEPDVIPDENPFETPPSELPAPSEMLC
ncbi:MAG: hypothetical protein ABIX01_12570 [Chitinophagaceae bacterium]